MAVVGDQLPLVAISLSILKLSLFDFHDPILFVSIKSGIIIAKLVFAKTPIMHKSAETCERISDVVKQNELMGVREQHLTLPVADVQVAYVLQVFDNSLSARVLDNSDENLNVNKIWESLF